MIETIKNRKPVELLLTLFIFFQPLSVCYAEIYQWKDENGRVHFGDRPPDGHAEIVEVESEKLSDKEKRDLQKRRQKQLKLLNVLEEERKERELNKKQQEEYDKKVKAECDKTKKYKQEAINSPYLYEEDENGNKHILDEKEFDKHMQEIEKYLKKYC